MSEDSPVHGHPFTKEWLERGGSEADLPADAIKKLVRFNYQHVTEDDFRSAMDATMAKDDVNDRWAYFCGCIRRMIQRKAAAR